jgi:hypothetical protein
MRVLFIGDIVGKPGRRAVELLLQRIVKDEKIDFVIANGENAAGGMGITPTLALEMFKMGVHVLTSGNHVWAKKEVIPFLDEEPRLLRPANYPSQVPGRGVGTFELKNGEKITVANLEGRVFMRTLECPFRAGERIIEEVSHKTPVMIIDFHAEATSEKVALGRFLDGKVSAILGTHTHVQTADEKILDHGTAYITDVGMTGPMASVIGIREDVALGRFLTQVPWKFDVATDEIELQCVVIDINSKTGRSTDIQRMSVPLKERG